MTRKKKRAKTNNKRRFNERSRDEILEGGELRVNVYSWEEKGEEGEDVRGIEDGFGIHAGIHRNAYDPVRILQ